MAPLRRLAAAAFAMVASCNKCDAPAPPPFHADRADAASALTGDGAAPRPQPDTSAARDARDAGPSAASIDAGSIDAGASSCRLAYGPAEQPFRGPAALAATADDIEVVANDDGKPKVFSTPLASRGGPPRPSSFVAMRWPPCELAGRFAYCAGPGGALVRSTLSGAGAKQVAKIRRGTRVAAAALGGHHSVAAFLDTRRTTEGDVLQAFAVLDEGEVERLSEDGAGATTLRLFPRGEDAIAVYLDTRTSMVPVHARPVAAPKAGDKLALGADVVVFVGGAPERAIDFTVAAARGETFVLLPIARETSDFGMAAIPVHDPPKTDVAAVWSLYPNGLDPAPIAAAGAFVARVRPREREVGSPRILELGRLDATGAFASLGVLADGRRITDIAMTTDKEGGVWILYGDSSATFLERRVCPPPT